MNDSCSNNVCHATLISRLLYASPAWWGFASIAEKQHLQAVLNRAVKWGFYDPKGLSVSELAAKRDDKLFKSILRNKEHTLHQFLPPRIEYTYNLRRRNHDRHMPSKKDNLIAKNFLHRLLLKDSY